MKKIKLFDYQTEMLARIKDELANRWGGFLNLDGVQQLRGKALMVQMPTGTGKTYLMAAVVKYFLSRWKREVWIVAHRRELVEQTQETLERFGIEYAGTDFSVKAMVRVMSVQWLSIHHKDTKKKPGMIVIDEAHHSLADTYQEMWTYYPQSVKLGLTATPCRLRTADFSKLYDKLLMSWDVSTFITKGYLALYDYVVINRNSEEQMTIETLEKRGADGDFSISEMSRKLNNRQRINSLYESLQKYAKGKKGIVYAIDIEHAKDIAQYYAEQGLKAVAIDSKTPSGDRNRMVADFRESRLDCIVNVNLFDEGFDCPDVEFIQIARPTLSLSKYMQMVGRGLRIHPNKGTCVIIDNVGLYRMFGAPDRKRDWESMFYGREGGRVRIVGKDKQKGRIVDNTMDVVVNHSRQLSESKKEEFYKNSEPFEVNGRWGLKVGDDVVLPPIHYHISPFVGDYAAYEFIPGQWGVIRRNGKPCIPPQFKSVDLLADGEAILSRNVYYSRKVNIANTFTNEDDLENWWGAEWATSKEAEKYIPDKIRRQIWDKHSAELCWKLGRPF